MPFAILSGGPDTEEPYEKAMKSRLRQKQAFDTYISTLPKGENVDSSQILQAQLNLTGGDAAQMSMLPSGAGLNSLVNSLNNEAAAARLSGEVTRVGNEVNLSAAVQSTLDLNPQLPLDELLRIHGPRAQRLSDSGEVDRMRVIGETNRLSKAVGQQGFANIAPSSFDKGLVPGGDAALTQHLAAASSQALRVSTISGDYQRVMDQASFIAAIPKSEQEAAVRALVADPSAVKPMLRAVQERAEALYESSLTASYYKNVQTNPTLRETIKHMNMNENISDEEIASFFSENLGINSTVTNAAQRNREILKHLYSQGNLAEYAAKTESAKILGQTKLQSLQENGENLISATSAEIVGNHHGNSKDKNSLQKTYDNLIKSIINDPSIRGTYHPDNIALTKQIISSALTAGVTDLNTILDTARAAASAFQTEEEFMASSVQSAGLKPGPYSKTSLSSLVARADMSINKLQSAMDDATKGLDPQSRETKEIKALLAKDALKGLSTTVSNLEHLMRNKEETSKLTDWDEAEALKTISIAEGTIKQLRYINQKLQMELSIDSASMPKANLGVDGNSIPWDQQPQRWEQAADDAKKVAEKRQLETQNYNKRIKLRDEIELKIFQSKDMDGIKAMNLAQRSRYVGDAIREMKAAAKAQGFEMDLNEENEEYNHLFDTLNKKAHWHSRSDGSGWGRR